MMEQAGADALELNVYFIATDLDEPGATIEDRVVAIVAVGEGSRDASRSP